MAAAEAARVLAGRLGCSQRQARRYVARAAESGRVGVPDEAASAALADTGEVLHAASQPGRVSAADPARAPLSRPRRDMGVVTRSSEISFKTICKVGLTARLP